MPQLFTLPKQIPLNATGGLMAGAKAYFYQTLTTTPQNTYQDIGLTTPHANPVVADANGVFAPIYLDASLPSYRVKLTTSAEVLLYQVDDVPSGQDTGRSYRLVAAAPELIFEETDGAANNKIWRIRVNSEQMTIDIGNDAESVWTNVATIDRTGTTVDAVTLNNATITNDLTVGDDLAVTGDLTVAGAAALTSITVQTGTATLTDCTTAPTTTARFTRVGNVVVVYIPAITATSNSTSCSLTGSIPVALRPARTQAMPIFVEDNGAFAIGEIQVDTASSTFSIFKGFQGAFTNSGNKGLPGAQTFCYTLD